MTDHAPDNRSEGVDAMREWAQTRVWPSERDAFLAWYEAEQPDATGWHAVALYGAHTRRDDTE